MKTTTIQRGLAISASVIALAVLAACGGGGGGDSDTGDNTPAPVVPVVPTPVDPVAPPPALGINSSIVTSVPAPTYAIASEELAAFNLLNAERSRCGFGKVAEKTTLNSAALAHADWSLINNYYGHFESAAVPTGFTGVSPQDRATSAGYDSVSVTETLMGATGQADIAGYGETSVRRLLSSPYHLFGMMSPYKDIGISVRSVNSVTPLVANGLSKIVVYNFGVAAKDDFQTVDGPTVLTYPCEGVTGVNYRITGVSPNPVPGRDLAANPLGHPMLIMVRKDQTLVITSASLIDIATGLPVALRAPITASNDPNGIFGPYGNYMGYVAPDAPLATNSNYQATINGTNNGVAFSRTFTFSTGSGG